jgi:hypothetical protein
MPNFFCRSKVNMSSTKIYTKLIAALIVAASTVSICGCNSTQPLDLSSKTLRTIIGDIQQGTTPDNTDWQLTDAFSNAEQALFTGSSSSLCASSLGDSILAYPNANTGLFYIDAAFGPNITRAEFVMVDANMNVIKKITTGAGGITTALDFSGVVNNCDEVRVYYKINKATCSYQGHGDLKIAK